MKQSVALQIEYLVHQGMQQVDAAMQCMDACTHVTEPDAQLLMHATFAAACAVNQMRVQDALDCFYHLHKAHQLSTVDTPGADRIAALQAHVRNAIELQLAHRYA